MYKINMKKIIESNFKEIKMASRNITIMALILYLLLLLYLTLFSPFFGRMSYHRDINLLPFATISRYLNFSSSIGSAIINLGGNIIAFTPIGVLLPMVLKNRLHFYLLIGITIATSVSIEICQYGLSVGVLDIDDVILNLAGGLLGYFIYKMIQKVLAIRKNNFLT